MSSKFLIGITGYKRSGKDTAAHIIKQIDSEYQQIAFADPIKEMVHSVFDHMLYYQSNLYKDVTIPLRNYSFRDLYIAFGETAGRKIDKNIWIDVLNSRLNQSSHNKFIISDVRYNNEARYIKERGGVMIRIVRKKDEKLSEWLIRNYLPSLFRRSETGVSDRYIDYVIVNDCDIESLTHKISSLEIFP